MLARVVLGATLTLVIFIGISTCSPVEGSGSSSTTTTELPKQQKEDVTTEVPARASSSPSNSEDKNLPVTEKSDAENKKEAEGINANVSGNEPKGQNQKLLANGVVMGSSSEETGASSSTTSPPIQPDDDADSSGEPRTVPSKSCPSHVRCLTAPKGFDCKEIESSLMAPTAVHNRVSKSDCCPIHQCHRKDGSLFYHFGLEIDELTNSDPYQRQWSPSSFFQARHGPGSSYDGPHRHYPNRMSRGSIVRRQVPSFQPQRHMFHGNSNNNDEISFPQASFQRQFAPQSQNAPETSGNGPTFLSQFASPFGGIHSGSLPQYGGAAPSATQQDARFSALGLPLPSYPGFPSQFRGAAPSASQHGNWFSNQRQSFYSGSSPHLGGGAASEDKQEEHVSKQGQSYHAGPSYPFAVGSKSQQREWHPKIRQPLFSGSSPRLGESVASAIEQGDRISSQRRPSHTGPSSHFEQAPTNQQRGGVLSIQGHPSHSGSATQSGASATSENEQNDRASNLRQSSRPGPDPKSGEARASENQHRDGTSNLRQPSHFGHILQFGAAGSENKQREGSSKQQRSSHSGSAPQDGEASSAETQHGDQSTNQQKASQIGSSSSKSEEAAASETQEGDKSSKQQQSSDSGPSSVSDKAESSAAKHIRRLASPVRSPIALASKDYPEHELDLPLDRPARTAGGQFPPGKDDFASRGQLPNGWLRNKRNTFGGRGRRGGYVSSMFNRAEEGASPQFPGGQDPAFEKRQ